MLQAKVWIVFVLALGWMFLSASAEAVQFGRVLEDSLRVHEKPSLLSRSVETVAQGVMLPLSSQAVRNPDGSLWYRVKTPRGNLGYVPFGAILTSELKRDLAETGVEGVSSYSGVGTQEVSEFYPWNFEVRAMGGYGDWGGFLSELEASVRVPSRFISLGGVYLRTPSSFLGLSLDFRIFLPTRIEPEVRWRFGADLNTGAVQVGLNLGLTYPLGLSSQAQWVVYGEGGSLVEPGSALRRLWGAIGFGLRL